MEYETVIVIRVKNKGFAKLFAVINQIQRYVLKFASCGIN